MKTGFQGTFVISWSQTELDGRWAAPSQALRVGSVWAWTGEAVRVDGPAGVLPLGASEGHADLHARAALSVRRLLRMVDAEAGRKDSAADSDPLFDKSFRVTDGRATWTITVIETGVGRHPLLMFVGEIPPRHQDLRVVSHDLAEDASQRTPDVSGAVVCFTPGTSILTSEGAKPVEALREGDFLQTKDNGCKEILWMGGRRVSGARLMVSPHLAPVRLRAGALDEGVPDTGLLVSPDHRMMVRGAKARALFNTDEVLVSARDLINDRSIMVDRAVREVTYIHLMLPSHEIVFANSVETESFHPATAALDTLGDEALGRMYSRMPELKDNVRSFGDYVRRVLSPSEAAILRHDGRGSFGM
ncbi:MAG: Hint domain-containing protein [Marivivens sp.]